MTIFGLTDDGFGYEETPKAKVINKVMNEACSDTGRCN